jgi:hypothetical protein
LREFGKKEKKILSSIGIEVVEEPLLKFFIAFARHFITNILIIKTCNNFTSMDQSLNHIETNSFSLPLYANDGTDNLRELTNQQPSSPSYDYQDELDYLREVAEQRELEEHSHKPIPPLNPYQLFKKDFISKIRVEHPEWTFSQISQQAGEEWKQPGVKEVIIKLITI